MLLVASALVDFRRTQTPGAGLRRLAVTAGARSCDQRKAREADCGDAWLLDSGHADVIRRDPAQENGNRVSLRTVAPAVAPCGGSSWLRHGQRCVRYTLGEQLQINFGERRVEIGNVTKGFFFVVTLGYSRRVHVCAFGHEKQVRAPRYCIMTLRAGTSCCTRGFTPSPSIGALAFEPVRPTRSPDEGEG